MILIFLGGNVLMSLVPVAVRRSYFRKHVKEYAKTSSREDAEKLLSYGYVGLEYEGLRKVITIVSLYIFLSLLVGFLAAISFFYVDNFNVVGEVLITLLVIE